MKSNGTINMIFLILLLEWSTFLYSQLAPGSSNQQQVAMGQSKYTELTQASNMPKYGSCWMKALSQLQSTCDQLSDGSHSRLALQFANCLLAQTGQKTYPCDESDDISKCLENVDTNAWTSYSNFFTHTHNMCHFLKSQQWQELTHQTINKLSDTSAETVQKLEQSHLLQQELAAGQLESLEYHRQLVENGSYLSQAIEASRGNVREMLDEFKLSTLEQRNMLFEVFDRVSKLQNLVVSEVSWLYTVVFYCFCLLVIYLVTATRRTADARLWLFLILTINFGLERMVIKMSIVDESASNSSITEVTSEVLNQRIWAVRNSSVAICFLTLVVMAFRFKDYNLINNRLLEDIQKQNLELKRSMETFKIDNKNSYNQQKPGSGLYDTLDGLGHLKLKEMLEEDTGWQGDEEDDFSDNDSDDSFNSTQTDRTFNPEDFSTAVGSRETTPTPFNDINLAMEDIDSRLVVSTPLKSGKGVPQLTNYKDDISRPTTSNLSTDVIGSRNSSVLDSSSSSRYNFRPRSRSSFSSVKSPSPTQVSNEEVINALNVSNRNKTKIQMGKGRKSLNNTSDSESTPKKITRRKRVQPDVSIREEFSADEN